MITRISFPVEPPGRPPSGGPVQVRHGTVIEIPELAHVPYEHVLFERFTDEDHLAHHPTDAPAVVATEHVVRGADWLEAHRRDGTDGVVHLALAHRAPGLTQADFCERWRGHGGRAPARGASIAIPEEVRGRAYVQHHALAPSEGEWAYDGIGEVHLDDVDALRRRVRWFAENMDDLTADGLFVDSRFMAVRVETV